MIFIHIGYKFISLSHTYTANIRNNKLWHTNKVKLKQDRKKYVKFINHLPLLQLLRRKFAANSPLFSANYSKLTRNNGNNGGICCEAFREWTTHCGEITLETWKMENCCDGFEYQLVVIVRLWKMKRIKEKGRTMMNWWRTMKNFLFV